MTIIAHEMGGWETTCFLAFALWKGRNTKRPRARLATVAPAGCQHSMSALPTSVRVRMPLHSILYRRVKCSMTRHVPSAFIYDSKHFRNYNL